MLAPGRIGTNVVLAAVSAVLALSVRNQIGSELRFDPPTPPERERQTIDATAPALLPGFPRQQTFGEIARRPLFSQTRRPPRRPEKTASPRPAPPKRKPSVGVVAKPQPPTLQARLVGVARIGNRGTALIQDDDSGELRRLSIGDDYRGWSVLRMDGSSVTLASGGFERTLQVVFREKDSDPAK